MACSQSHCDCATCDYHRTLHKIALEYERGLMVDYEYAERVLLVTAEYLNSQNQQNPTAA